MNLKEFFTAFGYYGSNPVQQANLNAKLYGDFVGWGQNSKSANQLQVMIDRVCKYDTIHPDDLIALLNRCGFNTWEQLEEWLIVSDGLLFNPQGYIDIIDPPVPDLGTLQQISVYDLRYIIRSITGIHPFDLVEEDMVYQLIPKDRMQDIIDACPADRQAFVDESRDCDDYVRMLRGWLSRWGYGNLAIHSLTVMLRYKGVDTYRHKMAGISNDANEFWFFDPQGAWLLWKFGEYPKIANCDEIKIEKILI